MRALAVSIALLAVAMAFGVAFGTEPIALSHVFDAAGSLERAAILEARVPRVVLGAIAGGGLAAVGVAFQAVLRNPLAEPYVLGVSGGSALGATIAILTPIAALPLAGAPIVPLAAFFGGVGATLLVYALVRATGQSGSAAILLAGVVVNAIASALITFLKTIVGATKAQELLFWLVGFLDVQSWTQIAFVALYVAAGFAVLLADAGRLNLLALGDEGAKNLGVDVRTLERRTFFAASADVGAVVSLTGLIGFVGLMVPHALRRITGPDVRVLLPASFFAGGAVLVLCDLASRLLFRVLHTEPPVGAVTALVGGPLFLVLLRRKALGTKVV
jgi:iron complex transport system permease protein